MWRFEQLGDLNLESGVALTFGSLGVVCALAALALGTLWGAKIPEITL